MIDSLRQHRARAVAPARTLAGAGIDPAPFSGAAGFGVVTLHRPSNVDSPDTLGESIAVLCGVASRVPLVWPVHPRTRANLERFGFAAQLAEARIAMLEPQGYLEMLGLLANAKLVLTDSGGIQEETTALSVPCLTMRENTERPITVTQGTNELVGRDRAKVAACVDAILESGGKRGRIPELWDGNAALRIASHLRGWLAARSTSVEQLSV
jgi:UDP-N-acetylglucosamine 2-epimerase (non-hydrolysing)